MLAPLDVAVFLRIHWSGRAFVQIVESWDFDLAKEISEPVDAVRTLEAFGHPVSSLRKNGSRASVPIGRDAPRALRAGFACCLRRVERALPALPALLGDACRWPGLPPGSVTSEIFCSSGESGVAVPSDFDVDFAFLLFGRKRWKLAENTSTVNQTSMCFAGDRTRPDPVQLSYADHPFPPARGCGPARLRRRNRRRGKPAGRGDRDFHRPARRTPEHPAERGFACAGRTVADRGRGHGFIADVDYETQLATAIRDWETYRHTSHPDRHPKEHVMSGVKVPLSSAPPRFAANERSFTVPSGTAAEVPEQIHSRHPALRRQLLDSSGKVLPFITIFVDEANIRDLSSPDVVAAPSATVLIMSAVAGG
ncbi:hypothetical protein AB0F15_18205 [Amycolatopsis sp. NPDC026612]|uniref:hypothetical protein n=1 Tax=Amycolatopsis sp. NPDC026612 TaxID=3155466 RepID=UPI0033EF1035